MTAGPDVAGTRIAIAQVRMHWTIDENLGEISRAMTLAHSRGAVICAFAELAVPGMALLRYRARLNFPSGREIDRWHTDSYEWRGTAWLAVWSQATAVKAAA